jgi:hypothetical protein
MKTKTNLLWALLLTGAVCPLSAQIDRDPIGPEKGVSANPVHRPIPPSPRDEKRLSDQDVPPSQGATDALAPASQSEGMSERAHRPIAPPPTNEGRDGRLVPPSHHPAAMPSGPSTEGDSDRTHRPIAPPPTDERIQPSKGKPADKRPNRDRPSDGR